MAHNRRGNQYIRVAVVAIHSGQVDTVAERPQAV